MGEFGVALILVFPLFWNAASAGSISVLECALIRWLGGCCRCVGPSALLYLWAAQTVSTVSDPVTEFCGFNIMNGFSKRCNDLGGSDGVVNVFQTIWLYWTSSIFSPGNPPQEIWRSLRFEIAGYLLRNSNVLLDSWPKLLTWLFNSHHGTWPWTLSTGFSPASQVQMLLVLPQGYKLDEVCKLVSWNTSRPPSSRSEKGPSSHHIDMTAGGGWILPTICLFNDQEHSNVWNLFENPVEAARRQCFFYDGGWKQALESWTVRGSLEIDFSLKIPKDVRLSNETDFTQKGDWRLFLVLESTPLLIQASPTPYAMMKKWRGITKNLSYISSVKPILANSNPRFDPECQLLDSEPTVNEPNCR